jgi:hypothetical protein
MELSVFFTAWKMAVRYGGAIFSNLLLTEGHIIAYYQQNKMIAGAAVSALSSRQDIDFVFVLQRFQHIRKLSYQHRFLPKAFCMATCSRVFLKGE